MYFHSTSTKQLDALLSPNGPEVEWQIPPLDEIFDLDLIDSGREPDWESFMKDPKAELGEDWVSLLPEEKLHSLVVSHAMELAQEHCCEPYTEERANKDYFLIPQLWCETGMMAIFSRTSLNTMVLKS